MRKSDQTSPVKYMQHQSHQNFIPREIKLLQNCLSNSVEIFFTRSRWRKFLGFWTIYLRAVCYLDGSEKSQRKNLKMAAKMRRRPSLASLHPLSHPIQEFLTHTKTKEELLNLASILQARKKNILVNQARVRRFLKSRWRLESGKQ